MPRSSTIPIHRLQAVDKLFGFVACALGQPFRVGRWLARRELEPTRILVVKFWGLGSLQLLTPAVRALRRRHPGARLTLLTLDENAEIARGLAAEGPAADGAAARPGFDAGFDPIFDEVRTLDIRSDSWTGILRRIVRLCLDLRRARFGAVYDFEFFTRFSALVSLATGAPELHGFRAPTVWRGGFHTRTVPFNRYWHVARNFRALAGGEDGDDVKPEELAPFRVDDATRRRVAARLASEVPGGLARGYAVVNPNAGRLSLERRWPQASYAALVRRLVVEDGLDVVLVGAPGERTYTGEVALLAGRPADGAGARAIDLSGRLTQAELCALLAGARVVVSNDSGPMHLAAALGAPTVGLFGPETPVMYRPLGRSVRVLYEPPVCSPCINVHDNKVANCIHGRPECLVKLSVEAVLAATRELLAPGVAPAVPGAPTKLRVLPGPGATGAKPEAQRAEPG